MPIIERAQERGLGYNAKAEGVTCDGTTDDTDAFQALVTKAMSNGDPIIVPHGTPLISSSIYIVSNAGFVLGGSGASVTGRGTYFRWNGDAVSPMFRVQDANMPRFSDFTIRGVVGTHPLHSGVWLENPSATATATQQRSQWNSVIIDGGSAGGLHRGWVTREGTGLLDGNNDFHSFINCRVVNYDVAGFLFNHSQSKANVLWNCMINANNALARVGVGCGYDWDPDLGTQIAVSTGGSFQMYGGYIAEAAEAALICSVNGDTNVISGLNCETATRLLIVSGPSLTAGSTQAPNTVLQGVRYAAVDKLHADGFFVLQYTRGPISLQNCRVEANAGFSPQIKQAPGGSAGLATCSVVDSLITSESTTLFGSQNSASRGYIRDVGWRNLTAGTFGMYGNGVYGAGPLERWGAGSPEGVLVAPPGSVFHRSDGGAGTSLYVKEANTTANGWVAK